jgi:hypothetical protein
MAKPGEFDSVEPHFLDFRPLSSIARSVVQTGAKHANHREIILVTGPQTAQIAEAARVEPHHRPVDHPEIGLAPPVCLRAEER